MNDVVQRLCDDLVESGIPSQSIARVAGLYQVALAERWVEDWDAFYRAVFTALEELPVQTQSPRSERALDSLLRIIEDDHGLMLFGEDASKRLRHELAVL
jgi:hypothetical protein